jgi:hypothetical protein
MAYFTGTIAHGTTGTKTITVGFQPMGMRITVGASFGTGDNYSHRSTGVADGSWQYVDSFFQDSTGGKTVSTDTKLVSHYERVGGVITEVLSATFNSFTATQVKYNITKATPAYNLLVEVWG